MGMNRIHQGKVIAVEIPAPRLLSAATGERNQVRCRNQNCLKWFKERQPICGESSA